MNEKLVTQLCRDCLGQEPESVKRCAVGQANYVYIVECEGQKITIRCSTENDAYENTIYWLERLSQLACSGTIFHCRKAKSIEKN